MNKLIPLLAIGYVGAITNLMTDAKSLFGALAALASFIASCYAIAIARRKLKQLGRNERHLSSEASAKEDRAAKTQIHTLVFLALIPILVLTACTVPIGKSIASRIAELPATILDSAAKLVTTTTTNIVEQAVVTATDVVTQDPLSFILTTNTTLTTNYALVTNITATTKPAAEKSIAIAETASGFLPPPYGDHISRERTSQMGTNIVEGLGSQLAAGIFALASAGLTAAVRRRNAMLKTIVDGVERAGVPAVKEEISAASMRDGTAPALHALVKQLTQSK